MALSQITLFDFNDTPEQPAPAKKAVVKKEKPLVIDPVPVEVEFVTVKETPVKEEAKKKSTRGRKSLKEMNAGVDLIEVPEDEVLFQKMYYSIGTVAGMFKVNQSLIRFWENEFDILKPKKNRKGDRLFRPEDIKNLQLIYHLMRERKYTMEGAKDFIKNGKKAEEKFAMIASLKKIKGFLLELKANL